MYDRKLNVYILTGCFEHSIDFGKDAHMLE